MLYVKKSTDFMCAYLKKEIEKKLFAKSLLACCKNFLV